MKILLRTLKGGMNGIHLEPLIAMPKTGNAKATAKLIRIGYVVHSDYAMPILHSHQQHIEHYEASKAVNQL